MKTKQKRRGLYEVKLNGETGHVLLRIRYQHTTPERAKAHSGRPGTECILEVSGDDGQVTEFRKKANLCLFNYMGKADIFSKKEGREASLRLALKASPLTEEAQRAVMGMECKASLNKEVNKVEQAMGIARRQRIGIIEKHKREMKEFDYRTQLALQEAAI